MTSNTACHLYLIRHGATDNNLAQPPRLQGRGVNLGLSAGGQQQAQRTAQFLRDMPIEAVYCSSLLRSRETAQAIAAVHNLAVNEIEGIAEVDVGDWEGRSWVDIQREDPHAYRQFMDDPGEHGYRGGENLSQVQQRVAPALRGVMQRHPGQSIVVVGHNVVNRAFLALLLELPLAKARGISQDNCGINLIRYRDDQWKVITTNAVFHL